jgi:hypothetical protein
MRAAGMQKFYFQAVFILDGADFSQAPSHLVKPLCHLASAA